MAITRGSLEATSQGAKSLKGGFLRMRMAALLAGFSRALPRGRSLPDDVWLRRHRVINVLVFLHSVGIFIFGMVGGYGFGHSLLEGGVVALMGTAAAYKPLSRNGRMAAGTLGLVMSSAILVHLSGGLIEMHFHFFVMVAIITLYQSWLPFLLAIGFVVLHHGLVGALSPQDVYNHAEAIREPWRWAALHGSFIMGESAAGLAAWRLNEIALERLEESYVAQLKTEKAHLDEQRRAKEAILQSEERFRSLVQNSFDMIAVVRGDGVLTYVSPSVNGILGYRPEDLIGQVGFSFVHPDDETMCRANHAAVMAKDDRVLSWEFRARHTDGSWRWIEATVKNLLAQPAVGGIVAHMRDVSEAKSAAEENLSLEAQLRQSQKMDAVGQLAGGVAHDFNNLLVVIQNYATFVIEDLDEDDTRRADVVEIRKAGDKAANLIRQLLTFSRKEVIQPERFDLNDVLNDLQDMFTRVIPENVLLNFELAPPPLWILADRGNMEQVLMNLVVNARDAMASGGELTIATRKFDACADPVGGQLNVKGMCIELAIKDTGVGMSPEIAARVFEPFFTTKQRGAGTGLGLSTVYGIVKQAGGDIVVSSEEGVGTEFKVYFPVAGASVEESETPSQQKTVKTAQVTETVLVAEDEAAVRDVIDRILTRTGYRVLSASNGDEALQLAHRHEGDIDLLLTDVVMPEMSGKELAERLSNRWSDVPTLFMSGYTDDIISHHGVLDDPDRFLEKPFTPEMLVAKIRQVMDSEMVLDSV